MVWWAEMTALRGKRLGCCEMKFVAGGVGRGDGDVEVMEVGCGRCVVVEGGGLGKDILRSCSKGGCKKGWRDPH